MINKYSDIKNRLRYGFGAQSANQILNLLIRFIEVPMFLFYWGIDRYGEWLIISAIPAYLVLADGGFTNTAQREMNMRMGSGDRPGAITTFQSTWILLVIISAILIFSAYVSSYWLFINNIVNFNSIENSDLPLIFLLLATHVSLSFQCGLLYGIYSSEKSYARGTVLLTIASLLDFLGIFLALLQGGGALDLAINLVIARCVGVLIIYIDKNRLFPEFTIGIKNVSKSVVKRLISPSLASLAFPLGNALNIQGMTIIIGVLLGSDTVAIFNTLRTLARLAIQPRVLINRLIEPEIALSYGSGNTHASFVLITEASKLAFWIVGAFCLLLFLLGDYIVGIWTSGEIAISWSIFSALLIAMLINSLWYTAFMLFYATNRHEKTATEYMIIYGAGMLLAAYLSITYIDIHGIGLSIMFSEVIMAYLVITRVCQIGNLNFFKWFRQILTPPKLSTYLIKS